MSSNDVANLPDFPGEDFIRTQVAAAAYIKVQVEARLAELSWLAAALGLKSEAVKAIVDIDLTRLPELEPTHREARRMRHERVAGYRIARYTLHTTARDGLVETTPVQLY